VRAFTRLADSASFASKVDKKGRVLLSAGIRKRLCLRFGSKVIVYIGAAFSTSIDERGRFVVPSSFRQDKKSISGIIRVLGSGSKGDEYGI
jgi:bifunctional DNA-binding transcriptional regulator/antitoxin component of YhaV-PrlF toxin-antitoxin module